MQYTLNFLIKNVSILEKQDFQSKTLSHNYRCGHSNVKNVIKICVYKCMHNRSLFRNAFKMYKYKHIY